MAWEFSIDLVEDYRTMITERQLKQVKREVSEVIKTRGWNTMEIQSDRNLISNDPIFQYMNIPVLFANTLYRLYPKNSSQKKQYHLQRLFTMMLFNYLQQRVSRLQAARYTIEAVADRLQSFDDIDLYIEFIFLPLIESHQDKLLMYLLLSQTDPQKFATLRERSNPLEELPAALDLAGTAIKRHRYLSNDQFWCRVRHPHRPRMIIDIPRAIQPQLGTELIHLGHTRAVGTVDKSLDEDRIRNSIDSLFPLLWRHPRLERSGKVAEPGKGSPAQFRCTQNGLSLMFDKMDADLQEITLVQLQNTFLPLRSDTQSLSATNLIQDIHTIDAYSSSFRIKFHPSILPDSYPSMPATTDRIGIYDLPLADHQHLQQNLRLLASHLPLLFESPRLELDWISFDLSAAELQPLWHYLFNHWGGDIEFIDISPRYEDVSVMIRGINDGAHIRVILRREYCHTHFANYARTVSAAEEMVRQHALDQVSQAFEDYFEHNDLDISQLRVLELVLNEFAKSLEVTA